MLWLEKTTVSINEFSSLKPENNAYWSNYYRQYEKKLTHIVWTLEQTGHRTLVGS